MRMQVCKFDKEQREGELKKRKKPNVVVPSFGISHMAVTVPLLPRVACPKARSLRPKPSLHYFTDTHTQRIHHGTVQANQDDLTCILKRSRYGWT